MVYVQPSIREFVFDKYPGLKTITTDVRDSEDIVFVVQDCDNNFITSNGILIFNTESLDTFIPVITEFFELVATGIPLGVVFKALITFLTGEE